MYSAHPESPAVVFGQTVNYLVSAYCPRLMVRDVFALVANRLPPTVPSSPMNASCTYYLYDDDYRDATALFSATSTEP